MLTLTDDSLRGSFTPIVTPFHDGRVDLESFQQLVELQVEQGGHGIVVNGTSAEPSSLTVAERNELVSTAVRVAAGRCQVVAATGSQSLVETFQLTEHATECGADAILVVTPYYIRPPRRGLVDYFAAVGERSDRPLLIYHIPGRAAVSVDVATVEQIATRVPTLVGIKHAVNDLDFVSDCLLAFGSSFRIFVGLESLSFPMLALGAVGVMNAVGNVAVDKIIALCDAMQRLDLSTGRALHFELYDLNQAVFWDTNPIPIKYMMKKMGLIRSNEHRLPMVPATPELERRLDRLLLSSELIKQI